jgi:hypothetical protein
MRCGDRSPVAIGRYRPVGSAVRLSSCLRPPSSRLWLRPPWWSLRPSRWRPRASSRLALVQPKPWSDPGLFLATVDAFAGECGDDDRNTIAECHTNENPGRIGRMTTATVQNIIEARGRHVHGERYPELQQDHPASGKGRRSSQT